MTKSLGCLFCSALLLLLSATAWSATLEGQAVDSDGQPVPGAQIWVLGFEAGEYFIVGTAAAGADGKFEIDDVPEKRGMELFACRDGYSLGSIYLGDPRRRPLQAVLAPGIHLSGRVRDPEGRPVEGAEVVAHAERVDTEYNAPDLIPCGQTTKALSKKDGTFSLGPLPPGIWTVPVYRPSASLTVEA